MRFYNNQILTLLITVILSYTIIAFIAIHLSEVITGISSNIVTSNNNTSSIIHNYIILTSGQIGIFLIPGLILYKKDLFKEKVKNWIHSIALTFLLLISSIPIAESLNNLNFSLYTGYFGEYFISENKQILLQLLSVKENLLLNILIFAIIPAIGEELIFRGVFLKIVNQKFKSNLFTIISIGLIFSAFHFELESFIPRFFLGCVLTYIMIVTKNIIFPILYHLINNSLSVLETSSIIEIKLNSNIIMTLSLIILIITIKFSYSRHRQES